MPQTRAATGLQLAARAHAAGAWTARAVPLGPVAATGFARLPEQLHVFVWRLAQNRAYILHVFYTTGCHAALPNFFPSAYFFPVPAFALILFKDYFFVENKKSLSDAAFSIFWTPLRADSRNLPPQNNKNVSFDTKHIFYIKIKLLNFSFTPSEHY